MAEIESDTYFNDQAIKQNGIKLKLNKPSKSDSSSISANSQILNKPSGIKVVLKKSKIKI